MDPARYRRRFIDEDHIVVKRPRYVLADDYEIDPRPPPPPPRRYREYDNGGIHSSHIPAPPPRRARDTVLAAPPPARREVEASIEVRL